MTPDKCPNCGARMVQLLFSVVCADACEKRVHVKQPLTELSIAKLQDPASYPLGNALAVPVTPLFPVIITLEDAYGAPVTGVAQVKVTTLGSWRTGSIWTEFDARMVSWKEKPNGLYEFQIPFHPPSTQWVVEAAGCRMRHGIISVP